MKLSIVTINRNNAAGLKKTLDSVAAQRIHPQPFLQKEGSDRYEIEHIIVDGASTDGSVEVIKEYESCIVHRQLPIVLRWVSEKDKGIYNAMNKGILIALNRSEQSPHYIQILNSGDILAAPDVCARMAKAVEEKNYPAILYGNMIKEWPDGHRNCDRCGQGELTMLSFYRGTLNHDSAYIRLNLFEQFGLYDEELKICSDWEWYLKAIPLGGVEPVYVNIDVTIFDMTGVSESNTQLWPQERRPILEREVPAMILADYDKHAFDMEQMDRLRRHSWAYKLVYFLERVLFKLEKWGILG